MNKRFSIAILSLACAWLNFTSPIANQQSLQQGLILGYAEKGDSIEFVFGNQKIINVGKTELLLDNRRDDIKQVNLAGDFNGWSPDNTSFRLRKIDSKLYKLVLNKKQIGKKGEVRQFKFVLNGKYWIEPPAEAVNKFTGKDGNTNLTLQL